MVYEVYGGLMMLWCVKSLQTVSINYVVPSLF